MAAQHLLPILRGLPRLLRLPPRFVLRLLAARFGYFFTNRLLFTFEDPTGFCIGDHHQLISYWAFFVERETQHHPWVEGFEKLLCPVAIDVGANGGVFSHLLLTLNRNATLYVFEPLPDRVKPLEALQERAPSQIQFWNAACGEKPGEATLRFTVPGDTDARLSAVSCDPDEPNPDEPNPDEPNQRKARYISVPVVTLDTTVSEPEIFLLKLDVQGSELSVLRGARSVVSRSRYLLLELSTANELLAVQEELGEGWLHEKASRADYIFYRRETHRERSC